MILASGELHPFRVKGEPRSQRKHELRVISTSTPMSPAVDQPLILLADDDRGQRLLYRHCLEREGYRVVEAEDGRQCLELFVTEQPDIVLLDAVMPEMNGFDCCSEIKRLDGDRDTPILMITGLDDQVSVDHAFTAGASDYVTKPIHWAVVLNRLHRLIEGSHAQRALLEQRSREHHSLEREQALIRVIQGIRQSLDLETIFSTAVQEIGRLFTVERAMILDYRPEESVWTVTADYRSHLERPEALGWQFQDDHHLWIEGFKALRYLYHEDICSWHDSPGFCHLAEAFPGSWLQLPLILPTERPFPEGLWGCLVLVSPCHRAWPLEDKRALDTLTDQLVIAIHQAQLVGDLESLNRDLEQKVGERTAQLDAQIRDLQRIDALKDEFISRVSHELRTPLTSFKIGTTLLTQVLQTESLTQRDKVEIYLSILRTECEREIKLVNNLLDIQQLEANIDSEGWELVEIKTWLETVAEEFKGRILGNQQQLQIEIPENLPQLLTLPNRLREGVRELLDNACKHTPAQQTIGLRAQIWEEQIQLSVFSTGVEIPADEQPHLFDKFYQGPTIDPKQRGGTGLGLALAKARVQSLGGELTVTSYAHQTEFTIVLPLHLELSPDRPAPNGAADHPN